MPYAKPYPSTGRRHLINLDYEPRVATEFEAENLAPARIDLLADALHYSITLVAPEPALSRARQTLASHYADDGVYGDVHRHTALAETTIDAAETVRQLLANTGCKVEVHDRREADAVLRQARAREAADEEEDSLTANPNAAKTVTSYRLGYSVLAAAAGLGLGAATTHELGTGLLIGVLGAALTWLLVDRRDQANAVRS